MLPCVSFRLKSGAWAPTAGSLAKAGEARTADRAAIKIIFFMERSFSFLGYFARSKAETRIAGVRTSGSSTGAAEESDGYSTYAGTPLRPRDASAAVIFGSRDVQSALSMAMFFS